jgi:hypothetical protein
LGAARPPLPAAAATAVPLPPSCLSDLLLSLRSSGLLQDGAIHLEEEALGGLVRHIRHQMRINPQMVQGMLLDCAVQLSTKAPVYALLVGERAQLDGGMRGEGAWGEVLDVLQGRPAVYPGCHACMRLQPPQDNSIRPCAGVDPVVPTECPGLF